MEAYRVIIWAQLVITIISLATNIMIFGIVLSHNTSVDKDLSVIKDCEKELSNEHIRLVDLQHSISHEQTEKLHDIRNLIFTMRYRMDENNSCRNEKG